MGQETYLKQSDHIRPCGDADSGVEIPPPGGLWSPVICISEIAQ